LQITDMSSSPFALSYSMFGVTPYFVQFKYGRKKKSIGTKFSKSEANEILAELKNKGYAT